MNNDEFIFRFYFSACKDNLDMFINMEQDSGLGIVLSLKQLVNRFYKSNVNSSASPASPQPQAATNWNDTYIRQFITLCYTINIIFHIITLWPMAFNKFPMSALNNNHELGQVYQLCVRIFVVNSLTKKQKNLFKSPYWLCKSLRNHFSYLLVFLYDT